MRTNLPRLECNRPDSSSVQKAIAQSAPLLCTTKCTTAAVQKECYADCSVQVLCCSVDWCTVGGVVLCTVHGGQYLIVDMSHRNQTLHCTALQRTEKDFCICNCTVRVATPSTQVFFGTKIIPLKSFQLVSAVFLSRNGRREIAVEDKKEVGGR